MKNVIYKEITLPDHEDMKGTRICPTCEGMMVPCTDSSMFSLKTAEVTISGIKAYKCEKCSEVVYTSDEAKLIEGALKPFMQKEG